LNYGRLERGMLPEDLRRIKASSLIH